MSEPAPLFGPLKPATAEARIWTGEALVANTWRTLGDDEAFPIGGSAIVSLARWRSEQATLAALGVPVGIFVQASEALEGAARPIGGENDGYVQLQDDQRDRERARALAATVRRGETIDLPDPARAARRP